MLRFFAVLALLASPARAQDQAGEFDYYVLSLSWSANWCALEGDARRSPQCDDSTENGWIVHGLWPQYERGFPTYCRSTFGPPSRGMTNGMADIMGTPGLAWYQWNKHGVCAGINANEYFASTRDAYEKIARPAVFRKLDKTVTLPASLIEDAFVRDNPALPRDGITITCKSGYIQEARICMTRDLEFRTCGADVVRDCALPSAQFDPMR
tara:strand:+ start:1214 stop:1843 length:630 start_codon:yes stop_codon:yes gene_type:complete